jgi:hypothetical protein
MEDKEQAYQNFLDKLNKLSEETGVYIQAYGDAYYNPKLITKDRLDNFNDSSNDIYFELDPDTLMYVGKKGCPYQGEII